MLSTENIGLKKPGYNDEADIAVVNENMDVIDAELSNRYPKSQTYSNRETDEAIATAINALPRGLIYRGAVDYYNNLPSENNELGDTYSIKYQGDTGTEPDGNEYAWGEYDGTLQWIKLGVNAYNKDEINEMHSGIQGDVTRLRNDTFGTPDGRVTSNSNMDTYITPGSWLCPSSAVAKTLINCPVDVGFRIEVKALAAGVDRCIQIIYPNADTDVFCLFRRLTSTGFTSWHKVAGVIVNAITPAVITE